MAVIRLADFEDYELNFDGITAALYTYLLNLDFPAYDVHELRDRIVADGHTLTIESENQINELTQEGHIWLEWDVFETFKTSHYNYTRTK